MRRRRRRRTRSKLMTSHWLQETPRRRTWSGSSDTCSGGRRCSAAHMSVLKPDFFAAGRAGASKLPLGVSSLSVEVGARM